MHRHVVLLGRLWSVVSFLFLLGSSPMLCGAVVVAEASFVVTPSLLNSASSRAGTVRIGRGGVADEEESVEFHLEAETQEHAHGSTNPSRRSFLSWGVASSTLAASGVLHPASASAASRKASSMFILQNRDSPAAPAIRDPVTTPDQSLSSESCLLKLLPVRNAVFRKLEKDIQSISSVREAEAKKDVWKTAAKTSQSVLKYLDTQRGQLQPVFNQEDSTTMQILKGERGEQLIEALRNEVLQLIIATARKNETKTYEAQKQSLLALSEVGELLVESFPYEVPTEGKFSFLPRLLGRARVTFTMKRGEETLGNITMIADGFAAPITAGNFVDLCVRGFYTGLPIKTEKKKLGVAPSLMKEDGVLAGFEKLGSALQGRDGDEGDGGVPTMVTSIPVLGSYEEGFYDPLTAKPRRIPLEIIRLGSSFNVAKLTYARGFTDLSFEAAIDKSKNSKPVLSFDIAGLVALNHPDRFLNGGSSEFFSLRRKDLDPDKSKLMDGNYAPFGYIVGGYELYQHLQEGDVIGATSVSEWGALSLVKIRGTNFADVIQSSNENV